MFDLVTKHSYLGLFTILFAEEGGLPLPIPGDIFIAAVAALPQTSYFNLIFTVVGATLCGSTILFTLSRKFGHIAIIKFGRYIKITPQKVKKIENWFTKYGGMAIFIGRLFPGLRIVTPIVAGSFEVSYKTFWVYSALAAFIWANVYYVLGRFFSEAFLALAKASLRF